MIIQFSLKSSYCASYFVEFDEVVPECLRFESRFLYNIREFAFGKFWLAHALRLVTSA